MEEEKEQSPLNRGLHGFWDISLMPTQVGETQVTKTQINTHRLIVIHCYSFERFDISWLK